MGRVLTEEVTVAVGPVDAHVAERAALIARVQHVVRVRQRRDTVVARAEAIRTVMASQAQGEDHRPHQQLCVGRSMRHMAYATALHPHRWMLVGERPAFVRVAFQAGLLIALRAIDQARPVRHAPRGCEGAVRVVTIRARHEAFVYAVLEGHGKLRAHIRVAAVA